jgi:hypothetical protein
MSGFPKHYRKYDDWDEDGRDDDDEEDEEDEDDDGGDGGDEEDDWDDGDDEPQKRTSRLEQDLERLSEHFPLWIDDHYRFVVIRGVRLPPGYNKDETDLFLEIPADYPFSSPGLGDSRVYVSPHLRFRGETLVDLHPSSTPKYEVPGFGPWAWLCYQAIGWSLFTDDLVKFVEMVRADLTSPATN